jgi:hypothetical protein
MRALRGILEAYLNNYPKEMHFIMTVLSLLSIDFVRLIILNTTGVETPVCPAKKRKKRDILIIGCPLFF